MLTLDINTVIWTKIVTILTKNSHTSVKTLASRGGINRSSAFQGLKAPKLSLYVDRRFEGIYQTATYFWNFILRMHRIILQWRIHFNLTLWRSVLLNIFHLILCYPQGAASHFIRNKWTRIPNYIKNLNGRLIWRVFQISLFSESQLKILNDCCNLFRPER